MRLVDRDDQLATAAMGYAAFRAIAIEGLFPGDAETGFQAVLLVVDAGMDDFAVSRTGRGTDALRRLQHDDLPAGAGERTLDGQLDDPGPDDDTIRALGHDSVNDPSYCRSGKHTCELPSLIRT